MNRVRALLQLLCLDSLGARKCERPEEEEEEEEEGMVQSQQGAERILAREWRRRQRRPFGSVTMPVGRIDGFQTVRQRAAATAQSGRVAENDELCDQCGDERTIDPPFVLELDQVPKVGAAGPLPKSGRSSNRLQLAALRLARWRGSRARPDAPRRSSCASDHRSRPFG